MNSQKVPPIADKKSIASSFSSFLLSFFKINNNKEPSSSQEEKPQRKALCRVKIKNRSNPFTLKNTNFFLLRWNNIKCGVSSYIYYCTLSVCFRLWIRWGFFPHFLRFLPQNSELSFTFFCLFFIRPSGWENQRNNNNNKQIYLFIKNNNSNNVSE